MRRLHIKTLVLGPISTNTYICMLTDAEKEDMISSAAPAAEDEDVFEDATVKYTIPPENVFACFIVDPAANAPAIIEALGACVPSAILLTHGHFDHLMAVNDLREKYPDIKVYAHPADADIMLHPGRGIVRKEFTNQAVRDFVPVKDGQVIAIGDVNVEVISTPGHTKGGVCYYIANNKVMFSGDTLFKDSYGRTDFDEGSYEELRASIVDKLFVRLKAEGLVDILPGHMDPTTSEHEIENNPIFG